MNTTYYVLKDWRGYYLGPGPANTYAYSEHVTPDRTAKRFNSIEEAQKHIEFHSEQLFNMAARLGIAIRDTQDPHIIQMVVSLSPTKESSVL